MCKYIIQGLEVINLIELLISADREYATAEKLLGENKLFKTCILVCREN